MLTLPLNLGPLAKLCDQGAATRFATSAVHVIDNGDGTYRLEATDGRAAAVVRGNTEDLGPSEEFLIDGKAWQDAFAQLKKAAKKNNRIVACLQGESREDGGKDIVLSDPWSQCIARSIQPSGHYPPVDSAMTVKLGPHYIHCDPQYLRAVCDLAMSLGCPSVDVILPVDPAHPFVVTGKNEQGQYLDAIVMPLARAPKPARQQREDEPDPGDSEDAAMDAEEAAEQPQPEPDNLTKAGGNRQGKKRQRKPKNRIAPVEVEPENTDNEHPESSNGEVQ